MGVAGEFRIKNESGGQSTLEFSPKGKKPQDLVAGLIAPDVGGGVEDELGGGILGKQGEGALHGFVASAGPVLLQHRLFPKVGDGVEVQIDQIGVIEPQSAGLLDEALLQTQ